jgi:hypothetical protein
VPRLPKARAVLRLRRPLEGSPAVLRRDLAEALRLLGDARLGAVELKEQHRHLGQAEL